MTASTDDLSEYVAEIGQLKLADVESPAKQLAKHGAYTYGVAFVLAAKSIPLSIANLGNSKAAIVAAAVAAGHVTVDALAPAALAAFKSLRETAKARLAAVQTARSAKKVAKAKAIIAAAAATK